jgi:hypothetical protein
LNQIRNNHTYKQDPAGLYRGTFVIRPNDNGQMKRLRELFGANSSIPIAIASDDIVQIIQIKTEWKHGKTN